MEGILPKEVDHENNVPSDNRWCNLRICTRRQNSYNSSLRSDNTSGVKGVCWSTRLQKWRVSLYINGKSQHIGLYSSKEEAIEVNKQVRLKYHGEFAKC